MQASWGGRWKVVKSITFYQDLIDSRIFRLSARNAPLNRRVPDSEIDISAFKPSLLLRKRGARFPTARINDDFVYYVSTLSGSDSAITRL